MTTEFSLARRIIDKAIAYWGNDREFDSVARLCNAAILVDLIKEWLDEGVIDYKTGMAICKAFENAVESLAWEYLGEFRGRPMTMVVEALQMAVHVLQRPYHPEMVKLVRDLLPDLESAIRIAKTELGYEPRK